MASIIAKAKVQDYCVIFEHAPGRFWGVRWDECDAKKASKVRENLLALGVRQIEQVDEDGTNTLRIPNGVYPLEEWLVIAFVKYFNPVKRPNGSDKRSGQKRD